jgi:GTPase SAR1 family protein
MSKQKIASQTFDREETTEFVAKVVMVGDSWFGKTSVMRRSAFDGTSASTIGIDFAPQKRFGGRSG